MSAPTARRPDFDAITVGWGSDSHDDLTARCQLLAEFCAANEPLSVAEAKIARAMGERLGALGGAPQLVEAG